MVDTPDRKAEGANERVGLGSILRLRMGAHDGHYGGGLVDGARILQLFGDVATELLIRLDGDEGLFRAYRGVEFLAPVYAGDYIEVEGRITRVGRTSRDMSFEARKVIQALGLERGGSAPSAAELLAKPIIVCRAEGTCVTPLELQRVRRGFSAAPGGSGDPAAAGR